MAVSTAVDVTALASVVGIQTTFQQLRGSTAFSLPQAVGVIGQGNSAETYSLEKRTFQRANDVGAVYGFGSPLHLASKQLLPANGDGLNSIPMTIYPLVDAGGAVAATGTITPVVAATAIGAYRVKVNGQLSEAFTVDVGDSVAVVCTAIETAINSVLDMTVIATATATEVTLDAKWAGATGNDIVVSVVGPSVGVTFTIVQPASGATNPDVDDALALVGDTWQTMIVSCFEISDTATLDKYRTFGEGRWGALVRKPVVVYTGVNEADMTTATAVASARTTDRVNSQIPAPGSSNLPLEIAARGVARIAKVANNKPANDYNRQILSGLEPGTDGQQWDYLERDAAVKRGSSTTNLIGGEIATLDTKTMYFPVGDPTPAYAQVCTIVKLQNIIFNLDYIFESDSWAGAPLIPDFQATSNSDAKQPKDAVAEVAALIDQLALAAILSNPEAAKQSIVAEISATNPNRLDISFTVQISGNTSIISVDLNFGFYFG